MSRKEFYSGESGWIYRETLDTYKKSDVFFICPTVCLGEKGSNNWESLDKATKAFCVLAVGVQKEIYGENSRFFAPLYRQAAVTAYDLPESERLKCIEYAYQDVRAAFEYYLTSLNGGRPFILAGFSQGSELCIKLLKDYFGEDSLSSRLIACYAIGWRITAEEIAQYPHIRMAQRADDTGVLISFNSESELAEESMCVPRGVKTLAINPLNWRTDSTPADKSLNRGARLYDILCNPVAEKAEYTGAYIDQTRGTLKVTDVLPEEHPRQSLIGKGVYHLYDYQFFFRNLQENVQARIESWYAQRSKRHKDE